MALGFSLLFFTLHLMAVRNEILRRRLRRLSILAASAEDLGAFGGGCAMKDYSFYIFTAYGFAAVLVGLVVAKIALDYRDLKNKLARFADREEDR